MAKKNIVLILAVLSILFDFVSVAAKDVSVLSPNKKIKLEVEIDRTINLTVFKNNMEILSVKNVSMYLSNDVWGGNPRLRKVSNRSVNGKIKSPFYRNNEIVENYNSVKLDFAGGWAMELRMYDDAFAYRFVNVKNKNVYVTDEKMDIVFPEDTEFSVAYVDVKGDLEKQSFNSFENFYSQDKYNDLKNGQLMLLPALAKLKGGVKVCILESDLEAYPGMSLLKSETNNALKPYFSKYPSKTVQGGHNMLQMKVVDRECFLSQIEASRSFPWRAFVISENDIDLANSNISYLLSSPSKIEDTSWISPGKVAWEWWNDCNLEGVNFITGVNTETYKYYIDFASKNGIEYIILDEGWAVNLKADLFEVVPEIDLNELIDYGNKKGVGIILWAGYYAFARDLEKVCKHYSEMGIKGFKVDFMDRDDKEMVDFVHKASETAAKYHLVMDFHGMYKPSGLNRTWPNVLNFEGVFGLEQMKFRNPVPDMVTYDVTIPYIRQVSGPIDYTQGAMKNAAKGSAYINFSEPMSLGTRCRQLALYLVFDSPLTMMCDSPTNYEKEQETVDFITEVPTVWDETRVLDGKLGEYIVTSRRSSDTWFVGGITNWDEREIIVDFTFLPEGNYKVTMFSDGINAYRKGTDYRKEIFSITNKNVKKIKMAPGGGFVLKIKRNSISE